MITCFFKKNFARPEMDLGKGSKTRSASYAVDQIDPPGN